jgi:hypothetical protein
VPPISSATAGGALVGRHHGGESHEVLELGDARLCERDVLADRELVVIVAGAAEVASVAQPLRNLAAVAAAEFVELPHELGVVRGAEGHACGHGRGSVGRRGGRNAGVGLSAR